MVERFGVGADEDPSQVLRRGDVGPGSRERRRGARHRFDLDGLGAEGEGGRHEVVAM